MRENKSTSLIILSLMLLTLSLIFLCLWGYNYYNDIKKQKSNLFENKPRLDISKPNGSRDSLITIYTTNLDKLDSRINSTKISTDSLLGNIDNKLNEINKLKEGIGIILKNKNSNNILGSAREKIEELQQKITQLQKHNLDIENGNKNLKELLQQIISDQNYHIQNNSHLPVAEKKHSESTLNLATTFTVANIHLTAFMLNDEKDVETTQADETEKLNVSFVIKSNNFKNNKTVEIVIVVLQPNGRILQNSMWEAGTFDTPEGKKNYSGKMHIDYLAGESKKLELSLSTDKFQKGRYLIQIYFNGLIIGKMSKVLS